MSHMNPHPLSSAEIQELERSVPLMFIPALVSAIQARLYGELHEPDIDDDDLIDMELLHRAVDGIRADEIDSLSAQMSRRHAGKLSINTSASLMNMLEIRSDDTPGCLDT